MCVYNVKMVVKIIVQLIDKSFINFHIYIYIYTSTNTYTHFSTEENGKIELVMIKHIYIEIVTMEI